MTVPDDATSFVAIGHSSRSDSWNPALPLALARRLGLWRHRLHPYRTTEPKISGHIGIERFNLTGSNNVGLVKDAHGTGATSRTLVEGCPCRAMLSVAH